MKNKLIKFIFIAIITFLIAITQFNINSQGLVFADEINPLSTSDFSYQNLNEGIKYSSQNNEKQQLIVNSTISDPTNFKLSISSIELENDGYIDFIFKSNSKLVKYTIKLVSGGYQVKGVINDGNEDLECDFSTIMYSQYIENISFAFNYTMSDRDVNEKLWKYSIGSKTSSFLKEYTGSFPVPRKSKEAYFNSLLKGFLDKAKINNDLELEIRFINPKDNAEFTLYQFDDVIYYQYDILNSIYVKEGNQGYDYLYVSWDIPNIYNYGSMIFKRYYNNEVSFQVGLSGARKSYKDIELKQNTEYEYEVILVDSSETAVPYIFAKINKTKLCTKKGSKLLLVGVILGVILLLAIIACIYIYYPDVVRKIRRKK